MNQKLNKYQNWQMADMTEDTPSLYEAINEKLDKNLHWWNIFIIHPVMCLLIALGAGLVIYSAIYG